MRSGINDRTVLALPVTKKPLRCLLEYLDKHQNLLSIKAGNLIKYLPDTIISSFQ